MSGWIKIHRKLLDNPIVCKDSDYLSVWIYLLLNATHKDHPALFKGEKITLKPGQLITGRKVISERLSISDSKVKRILLDFESDQQIDRQRSNKNSIISIVNWDKYQYDDQQIDQQMTNKRPADDQQVTTNKNERKKEINNNNPPISPQKEKRKFAEFVAMTNAEYETLVSTYGVEFANRCIEILDNYKGATGKKYKSDYRAIRNWVIDRVEEERRKNPSRLINGSAEPIRVPKEELEWLAELERKQRERNQATNGQRRSVGDIP